MAREPRFMLDTHIASFAIRGANDALRGKLGNHLMQSLCILAITEAELLARLAKRPQTANLKVAVQQFLRLVEVFAWDRKAATAYGPLRAMLQRQGRPEPTFGRQWIDRSVEACGHKGRLQACG